MSNVNERTEASVAQSGKQKDRVAIIPVNRIRENIVALRPADKNSEAYINLADSVKKRGILTPIIVREFEDPENKGEILYGLIDGLQRWNAALDAGLPEIPAKITDMDQAEIEETQIIANAQKIETKPIQYAEAIDRLLQRNPTMTVVELGARLSKSPAWIYKMLGMLKKVREEIHPLIDDNRIKLTNAIELGKLPKEEQPDWVDRAMTADSGDFMAAVAARVKVIKDARRKGRKETPDEFQPQPNARVWRELRDEFEKKTVGSQMIKQHNLKTAQEGWDMAIAWAANMDPQSQVKQREKDTARKEKAAAESARKKEEKFGKLQEEAARTRAELEERIKNQPGTANGEGQGSGKPPSAPTPAEAAAKA